MYFSCSHEVEAWPFIATYVKVRVIRTVRVESHVSVVRNCGGEVVMPPAKLVEQRERRGEPVSPRAPMSLNQPTEILSEVDVVGYRVQLDRLPFSRTFTFYWVDAVALPPRPAGKRNQDATGFCPQGRTHIHACFQPPRKHSFAEMTHPASTNCVVPSFYLRLELEGELPSFDAQRAPPQPPPRKKSCRK